MRVHTLILGVLLAGCGDSRPGPQGDPGTLVTNALVNGGFEIWQRGSSAAPDMWGATDAGCSFAQETVEKRGGDYAMRVGCAAAGASAFYRIYDLALYKGMDLTLGIDLKSDPTSGAQVAVEDGVHVANLAYTGNGAWQRLTLPFSVRSDSTKLVIRIYPGNGTTYVDDAMLVVGQSSSVAFVPMPAAIDWLGTLRFYQTGVAVGHGLNDTSENLSYPTPSGAVKASGWQAFRTPMPAETVLSVAYASFTVWKQDYPAAGSILIDNNTPASTNGNTASYDVDANGNPELLCTLRPTQGGMGFAIDCEIGDIWQVSNAFGASYSYLIAWTAAVPLTDQ